jgi:hypothetical protein
MQFILKNHFGIGFLFGAVLPFVGYALLLSLNDLLLASGNLGAGGVEPIFDNNSLFLFAICLNLLPFTIYQRKRFSKSMRGTLGATLVYALVWLIWFGNSF